MKVYIVYKIEIPHYESEEIPRKKYFVDGFKTKELAEELVDKLTKEEAIRFKRGCKCYDCIQYGYDYYSEHMGDCDYRKVVGDECENYVFLSNFRYEYVIEEINLTWDGKMPVKRRKK